MFPGEKRTRNTLTPAILEIIAGLKGVPVREALLLIGVIAR